MKTVVYQSYRTSNVPRWIGRCLESCRGWAAACGFDYEFIDDRLFSYAPEWYRRKVNDSVLLVSDLARLVIAREFLGKGYGRTVWLDADLLVFNPGRFRVEVAEEYAFCRELWLQPAGPGRFTGEHRVNNAVTVFTAGNSMLDFYIHACESVVRQGNGFAGIEAGTRLLTLLHHHVLQLPLVDHVGLMSPVLLWEAARGLDEYSRVYMQHFRAPVYAANFCSSFRNKQVGEVVLTDEIFAAAVERLLSSRGEVLNRLLPPA